MSVIRNGACVLLVLAGMACWAQSKSAQVMDDRLQPPEGPSTFTQGGDRRPHHGDERRKHEKVRHAGVAHPPAALVEPQPAPERPATLAQQPPNAPQVSYRNGLLTVTANNSTLSDILSLVRSKTGASIEFPDGLSQERVAAVVGPAPAPQVLATLLNGTRFDYILLGMNGRPDLLQRAIITSRESGGVAAAGPAPASPARAATPAAAEEEPEAPEETVEQPEEVPQPQPQPAQAQPAQPVPQQQVPQQQFPQQFPQQQPQAGEQPQPGQPKTPEQLLQELQRMQQRQQQQQQPPQQ